jgi:hypothetical protein
VAPLGIVGVLHGLRQLTAPLVDLGQLIEHQQQRVRVRTATRKRQHEQPIGLRFRDQERTHDRAKRRGCPTLGLPCEDIAQRHPVARQHRRAGALDRPGREQLLVDHLLENPHAGRLREGRAQNLVPRDYLLQGAAKPPFVQRAGEQGGTLSHRAPVGGREQLLLLWRQAKTDCPGHGLWRRQTVLSNS